MGVGFLEIRATTGDEAFPVAHANVKVTDASGKLLYETHTCANGATKKFEIEAPCSSLTLEPNSDEPAFSAVNITVSAPGFMTEHIKGVPIVDTQTAIIFVTMRPLVDEENPITDDFIVVPDTIANHKDDAIDPPPRKDGAIDPPSRARVLQEVTVPEFITVHLGAPTANARNIRVRFSDYIKNVTSSEIFSTWPRNSLLANIHAIVTLALNRIYTEWYRSRGHNFDITNFQKNPASPYKPVYKRVSRVSSSRDFKKQINYQ